MKASLFPMLISLALLVGCGEEESFSRYPSVAVPEYTAEDYLNDLSAENLELVYNATCQLAPQAAGMGKILSAEDADPSEQKYLNATKAYTAIRKGILSENPYIAAVSLRFLQRFAINFKPQSELLELACQVKTDHPQVMFEQVALMDKVLEEGSTVPEPLLMWFLENRSWIASRSAYGLIGRLVAEAPRKELARRYHATENDRERLLIMNALGKRLMEDEIEIPLTALLESPGTQLHTAARSALAKNTGTPGVTEGLIEAYSHLDSADRAWIFENVEDPMLAIEYLKLGAIPSEECWKGILELYACDKVEPKSLEDDDQYGKVLQALAETPATAERLRMVQVAGAEKRRTARRLEEAVTPIAEELIQKIHAVRENLGMAKADEKQIWNELKESMKPLVEKTANEK